MNSTARVRPQPNSGPAPMASQWGSVSLVEAPPSSGVICLYIGLDDFSALVSYCNKVVHARDEPSGLHLEHEVTDPRLAWRVELLRKYDGLLDDLLYRARREARANEERETREAWAAEERRATAAGR